MRANWDKELEKRGWTRNIKKVKGAFKNTIIVPLNEYTHPNHPCPVGIDGWTLFEALLKCGIRYRPTV